MANEYAFPQGMKGTKVMVFVDGENLAARYGEFLKTHANPPHVIYEATVFAWAKTLMSIGNPPVHVIRHHYYTSSVGSEETRNAVHDRLAAVGVEAPRVFPKRKGHRSKRVDISLSVDMLAHAHRKNCEVAVLVTGDEDYVPLVQAVEAEGCRVVLWFFENGLSPALRRSVDHFFDLHHAFFGSLDFRSRTYL